LRNTVALLLLAVLLLTGCTREPWMEEPPEEVADIFAEEVVDSALETEAVRELETEPAEENRFASGSLRFWIAGYPVHAGGPVSDIEAIGVTTGVDLTGILAPGQISGNISARVDMDGVPAAEEPLFFFHAVNTSSEPMMIVQCSIYSLVVNFQNGVFFDSGDPDAPFATGTSTVDQLIGAYGEPDYYRSNGEPGEEMAYYAPFDSLYFSFSDGIVRQIGAIYAPYYQESGKMMNGEYFGNDACVLMDRFLDMDPYLAGRKSGNGMHAPDLEETIILGDMEIHLGCHFTELPDIFTQAFDGAPFVLAPNHYILAGKGRGEEFYLLNEQKLSVDSYRSCTVSGLVTHNPNYTNWGSDYGEFLPFRYQGLNNESGIADILSILGQPQEMHLSSSAHVCFVWMHYRDSRGNELRLRVDPMTDEIAEIRVQKFYSDAKMYS